MLWGNWKWPLFSNITLNLSEKLYLFNVHCHKGFIFCYFVLFFKVLCIQSPNTNNKDAGGFRTSKSEHVFRFCFALKSRETWFTVCWGPLGTYLFYSVWRVALCYCATSKKKNCIPFTSKGAFIKLRNRKATEEKNTDILAYVITRMYLLNDPWILENDCH